MGVIVPHIKHVFEDLGKSDILSRLMPYTTLNEDICSKTVLTDTTELGKANKFPKTSKSVKSCGWNAALCEMGLLFVNVMILINLSVE